MDNGQAKGINADQCAKNIIKAIKNRKKEVVFGGSEINLVWIRRFFPLFFYKLIRKIKPV
jgi:short-subunit dehydrogenase